MSDDDKIKTQNVLLNTIIVQSVNAIIGYIAVWLFKPVWTRITGLWNKNNESKS